MRNWMKKLAVVTASMMVFSLQAQEDSMQFIKDTVQSKVGFKVESIADAPVQGLVQVETNRGLFYVSEDGAYFMQGRIYDINNSMNNVTESALSDIRTKGLEAFADSAIVFKAKNEKYVVNVFTDITCGYCRKLHNEMADYNAAGITVRYLAYPRAGLQAKSYKDMVSVWCAVDQQKAMTDAKASKSVASPHCSNDVAKQYEFGSRVGVSGTPNIILPDGSMIPGYQPAKELLEALKQG